MGGFLTPFRAGRRSKALNCCPLLIDGIGQVRDPPGFVIQIRHAVSTDRDSLWGILEPILRVGETYALPREMTREEALAYRMSPDHEVFVAEDGGAVVGTYFLRANQKGGGAHVANCGNMTHPRSTGRGVARAMCAHSIGRAKARGFRAMQYNFVVSTNARAVRLWKSFGFEIAGGSPGHSSIPHWGLSTP